MADRIDRGLQVEGHNSWGFVIYRTTYDSESEWQEFLRRVNYEIAARLEKDNGDNILERHKLTIFDNKSIFENASTITIRGHFRLWAWHALNQEYGPPGRRMRGYGRSPRFQYCVQVDSAALASVVNAPMQGRFIDETSGWVKLIDHTWVPRALNWHYRWRTFDPDEFAFDPIEGITQSDVGWCKMRYQSWVTAYAYLGFDSTGWHTVYQRPPAVCL